MRLKPKRIKVWPNPWGVHPSSAVRGQPGHHSTIVNGRPCGVCVTDPDEGGEPGRLVGAWPDAEIIQVVRPGEIRNNRQRTAYTYLGESTDESEPFDLALRLARREPVELALTNYYAERIRDGSLIAADMETARAAGSEAYFMPVADLFPRLAREAARIFNAHFEDQDAYRILLEERRAAKELPPLGEDEGEDDESSVPSQTIPSPATPQASTTQTQSASTTAQRSSLLGDEEK